MKVITIIVFLAALTSSTATKSHACRSGFKDGRRIVKNEFNRHFHRDCNDLDELRGASRRRADREYRRARNFNQREFNRCAREGVQDMIERYERLCRSYHP